MAPPYADMIRYSANQWGDIAHPHDLSQMSLKNFVDGMMLAIANIHDATKVGGYYGILCGNQRKNGSYRNLSSLVERLAPGKLCEEIIKTQHHCVSDSRNYSNKRLIRISHEKLLLFKKTQHSSYFAVKQAEQKAIALLDATWLSTLRRMLQQTSKMDINSILLEFSSMIDASSFLNVNWEGRIEMLLKSDHFEFIPDLGVYSLRRY
ncbi:DNA adenine modification methylase [Shewanella sp. SG44-6]|uniref:DNA adenine modification methylase n=1 Tax=Shewanella sp. SG44-6 TaxID=2760959 RepID=UPI0016045949|nr:DNA adenine modification methylase [Shewanella sp. SG44-6]MBB1390214.1 DNA adenine modification methylase [Shewanella sp. SG44-6]